MQHTTFEHTTTPVRHPAERSERPVQLVLRLQEPLPALGARTLAVRLARLLATGASSVVVRDGNHARAVALDALDASFVHDADTLDAHSTERAAFPGAWSLHYTASSTSPTLTLNIDRAAFTRDTVDAMLPAFARVVTLEHLTHDRVDTLRLVTVHGRLHPLSLHILVAWVARQASLADAHAAHLTQNPLQLWPAPRTINLPPSIHHALLGASVASSTPAPDLPADSTTFATAVPIPEGLREALRDAAGDPTQETAALGAIAARFAPDAPCPRVVPYASLGPVNFRVEPPTNAPPVVVAPGADSVRIALDERLDRDTRSLALLHALAHTLLGHVQPGDTFGHWDSLADLTDEAPGRRWDRAVRAVFAAWFEPDRPRDVDACTPRDKALLGLHRMMRDRLGGASSLAEEAVRYQDAAYQRQAAQRLVAQLDTYRGAMLCDGVGLGKTYVATTVLVHYANLARRDARYGDDPFRVTILSPASVVETWEREAIAPLGQHGVSLDHVRILSHAKLSRVTATSDLLAPRGTSLSDLEHLVFSDLVIIDEAHNFRAASAQRTRVLRDLLRLRVRRSRARRVLLLTATPINNSLADLEQEVSLLFAEPLTLTGPTQRTDAAWERAAFEEIHKRVQRAREARSRQKDVFASVLYGPEAKPQESFRFRSDLQLGTMQLGQYLKDQEKALQALRERVRTAASLGASDEGPRPRIADELLDRIVVQRSRTLCKQIELQEGSSTTLLFRRDAAEPERLRYADAYDGTQDVLATFLPLFDEQPGNGLRPLTFKLFLWHDIAQGLRTVDETSPAVGLQRVLALKRLESSPVSFLITVLRLITRHAARLNSLVTQCNSAGFTAEARKLSQQVLEVLQRRPPRDLRVVRWLTAGDHADNPAGQFLQKLAGVDEDDEEPESAPVQYGLFNEAPAAPTTESDSTRRLMPLGDVLVGDLETLLTVVPRLANIVFGRFDMGDWPAGFARRSGTRRWPQSPVWADRAVTDPKLAALLQRILRARRAGQKVLVFSQFADTLEYLRSVLDACRALPPREHQRLLHDLALDEPGDSELLALLDATAMVTGDTDDRERVLDRFAPYYRLRPFAPPGPRRIAWEADWVQAMQHPIEVVLASDVLAEGVNLQDVSVLINYDIHWNPVRMIQRAGRIDRRLDARIEGGTDFPDLLRIAQGSGFSEGEPLLKVPPYRWHQHPDEAPCVVNMILPDALEEELSLRERIAAKTLAIDFTLGLERGTGAEADWMRDYRYRGVASLNAFQSDRAIERLGAVLRTVEKHLHRRGIPLAWGDGLSAWIRDDKADDSSPLLGRALLSSPYTELKPYTRFLRPQVAEGIPHWLWTTEPAAPELSQWLPLSEDHIGEHRTDMPFNPDASQRLRPEHLLAAAAVVLAPSTRLVERPSSDPAVGAEVFQGVPALAAGFFPSRDERLDVQMDEVFLLQLHALLRALIMTAAEGST